MKSLIHVSCCFLRVLSSTTVVAQNRNKLVQFRRTIAYMLQVSIIVFSTGCKLKQNNSVTIPSRQIPQVLSSLVLKFHISITFIRKPMSRYCILNLATDFLTPPFFYRLSIFFHSEFSFDFLAKETGTCYGQHGIDSRH